MTTLRLPFSALADATLTARAMVIIAIDVLLKVFMAARLLFLFPILALVEIGQLLRVEQRGDLFLRQELPLAHDLEQSFAALVRVRGQLRRLLVPEHGIER